MVRLLIMENEMNTAVWLVFLAVHSSGGVTEKYFTVKDMETCLASVKVAQVKIPMGGDAEITNALFCVNKKPNG